MTSDLVLRVDKRQTSMKMGKNKEVFKLFVSLYYHDDKNENAS